ncbi:unnamed protein product [Callosobruchus maculatus]|uniref:Uncharacterized protein n=1 Tax=Callosobruchus maculatus TaxID=64391 RepID=A0A653BD71_CALMS|nr:unnamed protein product [Callosobruchus maculatus]
MDEFDELFLLFNLCSRKYREIRAILHKPYFCIGQVPRGSVHTAALNASIYKGFGPELDFIKNEIKMWRPATIFSRPPSLTQCGPPGNSNHC